MWAQNLFGECQTLRNTGSILWLTNLYLLSMQYRSLFMFDIQSLRWHSDPGFKNRNQWSLWLFAPFIKESFVFFLQRVNSPLRCRAKSVSMSLSPQYWPDMKLAEQTARGECPAWTVLKFNQAHNRWYLITWGPLWASKDFPETYISCRPHGKHTVYMHVGRFLTFPVCSVRVKGQLC